MRRKLRAERAMWRRVTALIDMINGEGDLTTILHTTTTGVAGLLNTQVDIELHGRLVRADHTGVQYDGLASEAATATGVVHQPLGPAGSWGAIRLSRTTSTDLEQAVLQATASALSTIIDQVTAATKATTAPNSAPVNHEPVTLRYRPVVDLTTGRCVAAETLTPVDPLPPEYAERVVSEAISATGRWLRAGHDLTVTCNITASVVTAEFAARTLARLLEEGVPAHRLALELRPTDTIPSHPIVADLTRLGLHWVSNHYAGGNPPIMNEMVIHGLKIDPAVIARIDTDEGMAIVREAVRLGGDRAPVAVVSADGVHTDEQRYLAREAGCHVGQGDALGGITTAEELLRWLSTGVHGVPGLLVPPVAGTNVIPFHLPKRRAG